MGNFRFLWFLIKNLTCHNRHTIDAMKEKNQLNNEYKKVKPTSAQKRSNPRTSSLKIAYHWNHFKLYFYTIEINLNDTSIDKISTYRFKYIFSTKNIWKTTLKFKENILLNKTSCKTSKIQIMNTSIIPIYIMVFSSFKITWTVFSELLRISILYIWRNTPYFIDNNFRTISQEYHIPPVHVVLLL